MAEPDPKLRQLAYCALWRGYQTVQATSGEEAVRIAAKHEIDLDLLLTEVRLPHMDGWELAELLKLDYPHLKVVYLSGAINAEIRIHTQPSIVIAIDNAGFSSDCLRQAIHDTLEIGKVNGSTVDSPGKVF